MRTAVLAFALSFAGLLSTAAAQPAPTPTYAAPPPPPPEAPPEKAAGGVREHDGFYFGVALGMSYVTDSIDSNWFDKASLSGIGLADKIAIGGTVARGLVLGGAIEDSTAISPVLRVNGNTERGPRTFGLSLIGPFLDYYFDASSGLHAQLLLAVAVLTADDEKDLPVGFGGSLSIGYEWWIGTQSSLGLLARVAYGRAHFQGYKVDEYHSAFTPALLLQYTYH